MDNKGENNFKYYILAVFLIQTVFLVVLKVIFKQPFQLLAALFTIIDCAVAIYLIISYEKEKHDRLIGVSRVLGNDAKEAMLYGELGLIIYDDNYVTTWTSELFEERKIDLIGEKLTRSIEGIEVLFNGKTDTGLFTIADRQYRISRSDSNRVLYVRDVSELSNMQKKYEAGKLVLGLIHLDNYNETVQYEDEQKIAYINTNVRQKVVEWCKQFDAIVRRLRSDRFLVILSENNFRKMQAEKFTILEDVKSEAEKLEVNVSASMAFAYGSENFPELDEMVNSLLELVLSRGGDQVAVRESGSDVRFYGTSSESGEKTSKVKARVTAQTLKDIINESNMVFIVPHREADYDAVGSCLAVSKMVQAFGKAAYVVLKGITVESGAREVIEQNLEEILSNHSIVSEQDALGMMDRDSLVVVCDHHSLDLTSAARLVEEAKRVVVIDHHRRKTETNVNAMMIYNEPSSSSAVEMVCEMIQYLPEKIEFTTFEASFLYTGILVDTDGFRSRCSSRTFEVCAYLKKSGADITRANDWLKETIEQFETKTKILKYSEIVNGNIIMACLPEKDGLISRTMVAIVANYALSIKNIDAAFVVAQIDENTWACSGRSNGAVNVQLILEEMGGGGHFAAAGLQRKNSSTKALREELIKSIEKYLKGETSDESNTAE